MPFLYTYIIYNTLKYHTVFPADFSSMVSWSSFFEKDSSSLHLTSISDVVVEKHNASSCCSCSFIRLSKALVVLYRCIHIYNMCDMDEMNVDKPSMQLPFAPTLHALLHHWFPKKVILLKQYVQLICTYSYLIIYIAT